MSEFLAVIAEWITAHGGVGNGVAIVFGVLFVAGVVAAVVHDERQEQVTAVTRRARRNAGRGRSI